MDTIPENDSNTVNDDGTVENSPSWSFHTNWTVANGSLKTSVTVESSDTLINDENIENVSSTSRSQLLILKPTSSDSGPCEIKICFTQKYEIRQVYVRSTARVYEIYSAPSLKATDEYFCTIRCSTAVRDGEILQVTDIKNVTGQITKGSTGELTEAKYTGEANSSTSEDDWVDVKVPESPMHENGVSSLPKMIDINSGSGIQDLYEATAEISDADPCTSVTIRLLSLQNKGCVYVDEVYVFADLVDSNDMETQAVQLGSSSGSALMAMLVPTLMQISKSSAAGQMHEKNASFKLKNGAEEIQSVESTHVADGTHQDGKLSADQQNVKLHDTRAYQQNVKLHDARGEPAQFQLPSHDPVLDRHDDPLVKNDLSHSRIEILLEQLVSRVSRVEDFCSRFEVNMLKPINSMEARLQQVEQQLQILAKNSQYSGLPPCTRISALSLSCDESDSSSIYDDSSRQTPGISESEKRDLPLTDLSKQSNDLPIAESIPHFLPSLVITAPEFSSGEDDEDDDFMNSTKDPSPEKPKRPMSIDDALAAALSGFLSTSARSPADTGTFEVSASGSTSKAIDNNDASAQSLAQISHELTIKENDNGGASNFSQILTVTAPEFTFEGGDEVHSDYIRSPSLTASQCTSKEDRNEKEKGSQSDEVGKFKIFLNACVFCGTETIPVDVSCAGCAKQNMLASSVVVDEPRQSCEGETSSFEGNDDACSAAPAQGYAESENGLLINEEPSLKGPCSGTPSYVQNEVLSRDEVEEKCGTPESAVEGTECVATDNSILLNLTEPSSASVVDLEFPILDVKFASHESSVTESSLEALLHNVADISIQTPCVQDVDEKADNPPSVNVFLLDLGNNAEDSNLGGLHDPSTSSNQEISASLI